jgi:WD40 repeat protein
MNFVTKVPPKYDCEVLQDKALKEKEELIEDTGKENMIVLGFSKGTFAFVSVHKTDKIYARFSIHRQSIQKITQMSSVFLSICSEMILNIWGFSEDNIVVYKTLKTFRMVHEIGFTKENLMMAFDNRDSELFLMDELNKEIEMFHTEKSNEHSGRVNCIDTNLETDMFITGGKDGFVKVWTNQKMLIREI